MKKIIVILIFLYGIFFEANASADSTISNPTRLMLGKVTVAKLIHYDISESKIEAAMGLAAKLSGKYMLVSAAYRDSVANTIRQAGEEPTLIKTASLVEAEKIVFISVNRLVNMLRVELQLVSVADTKNSQKGIGYSYLRYRDIDNDATLYDPSLLQAIQRAFSDALTDSSLFMNCTGSFKTLPAKTLAIGGIAFENDEKLESWKIFRKKEINSYDLAENVFDEARNSDKFAVYDIETRDSIYSMFKMYGVENCNAPTLQEIEALQKLDVQRFLAGVIARKPDGLAIELYLCDIENKKFEIIKSENSFLKEDSMKELKKIVRELTRKLLNLKKES